MMGRPRLPVLERLLASIEPDLNTGCWLWSGSCGANGYGTMSAEGKRSATHRVAFRAFRGIDPGSLCVLHRCDTPVCINPAHLFLGDQKLNALDKKAKGRCRNGRTPTPGFCSHGHKMEGENLLISGGKRVCRACNRARGRASKQRRRARITAQTQQGNAA